MRSLSLGKTKRTQAIMFIVHVIWRSNCNKFIVAIRAPRKFGLVFHNFGYYFWGQRCCTEQKQPYFLNNYFVFCKFPWPLTFFLPPLPYRCSGVPASVGGQNRYGLVWAECCTYRTIRKNRQLMTKLEWCTYWKHRYANVLAGTQGCHINKQNGKLVMHQKIS